MIPLHLVIESQKDTRAIEIKHKFDQVLIQKQQQDAMRFCFFHRQTLAHTLLNTFQNRTILGLSGI